MDKKGYVQKKERLCLRSVYGGADTINFEPLQQ